MYERRLFGSNRCNFFKLLLNSYFRIKISLYVCQRLKKPIKLFSKNLVKALMNRPITTNVSALPLHSIHVVKNETKILGITPKISPVQLLNMRCLVSCEKEILLHHNCVFPLKILFTNRRNYF